MRRKVKEETKYLSPTSHRLQILDLINHVRKVHRKKNWEEKATSIYRFRSEGDPSIGALPTLANTLSTNPGVSSPHETPRSPTWVKKKRLAEFRLPQYVFNLKLTSCSRSVSYSATR